MDAVEVVGPAGTVDETLVRAKYERLTRLLIARKATITTMESCTAGQLASLITDTEGSSAVLRGAFVTYSNEAKVQMGLPAKVIEQHGVYSVPTANAMAQTCRVAFDADVAIGVTGTFGNVDPNNADSCPGEVFFALATTDDTCCFHCFVPAQPSRYEYKLYMADLIAEQLFGLLG